MLPWWWDSHNADSRMVLSGEKSETPGSRIAYLRRLVSCAVICYGVVILGNCYQVNSGDTAELQLLGIGGLPSGSSPTAGVAGGSFTISGTITGLIAQSITLQNGVEPLVIGANGAFSFLNPVPNGGAYNVIIQGQPKDVLCIVQSGGSGTVAGAPVTNVSVTCPMAQINGGTWQRCGFGRTWNGSLNGNQGGCQGSMVSVWWCRDPSLVLPSQNNCNGGNPSGSLLPPPYTPPFTSEVYAACNGLDVSAGGYGLTGWRTPTPGELGGLISGASAPFLDQLSFPGFDITLNYWTDGSSDLDNTTMVAFFNGSFTTGQKQVRNFLLCVR